MFFKSIPYDLLEKLRVPLSEYTPEMITARLNEVFGNGTWKSEFSHKQLFAISIPLVGPRGMEIQTSLTLWLTRCSLIVPVSLSEFTTRTSYILGPFIDEHDRSEAEAMAFINTACRVLGVGTEEKTQSLSIENVIAGRKIFLSERINDFIADEQAIKVIMMKNEEEEKEKERRGNERVELKSFDSIPALIQTARGNFEIEFFILDFSSTGLKIVAPFEFPEKHRFTMTLRLGEPLTFNCEVVWRSAMWNNNYYLGIKFQNLQLDKFEKLCRMLESFRPVKDDDSVNINRVIPAELNLWREPKLLPTFVHSISSEALTVIFPAFLQERMEFRARFYPFKERIPIEFKAVVHSSIVLKNGGSQAVLKIADIDKDNMERLESYIRYCVMEARHTAKSTL